MIMFLTTFWQMGLPMGIVMGLFNSFLYGWTKGFATGAFTGFLFGLAMATIQYFLTRKFRENRPIDSGEKLIQEGPANYHGNGGWFYLTDSRLLFVSHKLNIKTHEMEFPLADVLAVEAGRTLGLFPNKIVLDLRNGKREEFAVQGVKNWINRIAGGNNLLTEKPRHLEIDD